MDALPSIQFRTKVGTLPKCVNSYINGHLKITEWCLSEMRKKFILHFQCSNTIQMWLYEQKWYQPGFTWGNRNHSILSRSYFIHGVGRSQSWRLDKRALHWASRNDSEIPAAAKRSVLLGELILCHNKKGEPSGDCHWICWFGESITLALIQGSVSGWNCLLTPVNLGIGHQSVAVTKLNSWRCRKVLSSTLPPSKSKTSTWNWHNLIFT